MESDSRSSSFTCPAFSQNAAYMATYNGSMKLDHERIFMTTHRRLRRDIRTAHWLLNLISTLSSLATEVCSHMLRTVTIPATFALVAVVAAWIAPGACAANRCVQTCLMPYGTNTTASIKASCRDACKLTAPIRRQCLKLEKSLWREPTKTCRRSLRNIKRGLAPLTLNVTLTTPINATTSIPTTYTYTFDSECAKEIRREQKVERKTCRELMCPLNEYWTFDAQGCHVHNSGVAAAATKSPPLPALLRGFYKFSWTGSSDYQGPKDTNMGVTFTGRLPGDPEANIAPMTKNAINLLSYGGGNEFGAWSLAVTQAVADSSNLDAVIALNYDGIVIDAEVYATGQTVTVAEWNTMFAAIKARNLLLIVTISHFSPYGMPNANALVVDWLSNPHIDYLSPQLYTSGTETENDWEGFSSAWVSASTPIAPSIVQKSYYDQLGSNSVTTYLPNAKGYLVWSNTPPPKPGPGPTCVSGYFPGSGCAYMCSWCAQQLQTNNYYWTTGVCTYQDPVGCVGSPMAGVEYTCCRIE